MVAENRRWGADRLPAVGVSGGPGTRDRQAAHCRGVWWSGRRGETGCPLSGCLVGQDLFTRRSCLPQGPTTSVPPLDSRRCPFPAPESLLSQSEWQARRCSEVQRLAQTPGGALEQVHVDIWPWALVAALCPETRGAALSRLGGGQTWGRGQPSGRKVTGARRPRCWGRRRGPCGWMWGRVGVTHWVSWPLVDDTGLEESDCSCETLGG